ncbi:hypothetical protein L1987_87534 [Smallanthus sonchifolius]|nr:hypothetical protein L1987_87534 [Smallanthus sonchifolius]
MSIDKIRHLAQHDQQQSLDENANDIDASSQTHRDHDLHGAAESRFPDSHYHLSTVSFTSSKDYIQLTVVVNITLKQVSCIWCVCSALEDGPRPCFFKRWRRLCDIISVPRAGKVGRQGQSGTLNIKLKVADLYVDGADIYVYSNIGFTQAIIGTSVLRDSSVLDRICKHFLEAVEKKQYGWFWVCPNASTWNSELCEVLIEEGADIDVIDRAGQTPIMNAVICYNKEMEMKAYEVTIENETCFYTSGYVMYHDHTLLKR